MPSLHEDTFEYCYPTAEQMAAMKRLRAAAKVYADALEADVPAGPDKTYALRSLRTLATWANIAVTRYPDGAPRGGEIRVKNA